MKQQPNLLPRFLAVYVGLGVVSVAAIAAAVFLALMPAANIARKSDLGPQGVTSLLAKTEKIITQQAAANGFTLVSQRLYSEKRVDANTLVLVIRVETKELGVQYWHVTFTRGIWTPTGASISR